MTKFFGGVSSKVKGAACSGLPTHRHNYCKMLEFANKKFVKINSPYCIPLKSRENEERKKLF
jgi:hypothetical protein